MALSRRTLFRPGHSDWREVSRLRHARDRQFALARSKSHALRLVI